MKEFLKVGISGVRGVVGESLTPSIAASFARAFASFVGRGTVVVGRDTRPSGYALQCAIAAGLESSGCKPVLAGIVPTPTLCMLARELGSRGAIAITASHNTSEWNAMKFIGPDGVFLPPNRADELYDIYHQGDFELVTEDDMTPAVILDSPMERHVRKILDYVDVDLIRKRGFSVAVDCCNGVGALSTRKFLEEKLGCKVVACFDAPTGAFERGPEPIPENLGVLCDVVRKFKVDVGFAQDPDGDRLAIVDELGNPIGEDLTVALAVWQVLDRHRKGPVAIHMTTSRAVQRVAEDRGSEVIRTRIGEINVVQAMLENSAVVGGEGNGGVIVPAIHPCRDSYTAMALTLELMASENKTVSELRGLLPKYFMVKDKIRAQGDKIPQTLRALRRRYQDRKINLLDGVYVEMEDAWFHVRASNTEPVIRLSAEATAQTRAVEIARTIRSEIESFLSGAEA